MRRVLLISNSMVHGKGYLEHCKEQIKSFLTDRVKRVLFVPYALKDRDGYADIARKAFQEMGYELDSIHTQAKAVEAVRNAEAIFIGGGNTFRLLKTLYEENIVTEIKKRVTEKRTVANALLCEISRSFFSLCIDNSLEDSVPYMGSSAGSNVATCSINTTNDMPIVYPPSFKAIDLVNFNINAHYQDPDPDSKHMGETREKRIKEYHEESSTPVLGIREGSMLLVEGDVATLMGDTGAKLFQRGEEPREFKNGDDLSFLLKQ